MEVKNKFMAHATYNKPPGEFQKIKNKMSVSRRSQYIKVTLPTVRFIEDKQKELDHGRF